MVREADLPVSTVETFTSCTGMSLLPSLARYTFTV